MALARRLTLSIVLLSLSSCFGGDSDGFGPELAGPLLAENCLVRLHGKSERGVDPVERAAYVELAPSGNEPDGDGWRWEYADETDFAAAKRIVADTITASGCERVVLHGFSNGAALAAKLYCRGESFNGAVIGVVVDDPVPDTAVMGCDPDPATDVALYWTGGLDDLAIAGASCGDIGWICEGDTLLGIDRYADALGVPAVQSPFDDHSRYDDAPEIEAWLVGATTEATGPLDGD